MDQVNILHFLTDADKLGMDSGKAENISKVAQIPCGLVKKSELYIILMVL